MSNYNDTYCFIFENSTKMKEIIDELVVSNSNENLRIKNWVELDCEKFSPKPEDFDVLSDDEKRKWYEKNWGVIQDFYYKIFDNFTAMWIEGRNSAQYNLFEALSDKYNLTVYIEFIPEGGFDNYYVYKNPEKNTFFQLVMSDSFYNGLETPDKFINFSLMGIREDIYSAVSNSRYLTPLFSDGDLMWKQREDDARQEREKEKLEREEKMKKIQEERLNNPDEDNGW